MGCCASKSSPQPPQKPKPLLQGNNFQPIPNEGRIISFQTESSISLALSKELVSSEALELAEPNARNRGQFLAYLENSQVACFSLKDRRNVVKLECKVLKTGDRVKIGDGPDVSVGSATRQYINYAATTTYPPGTPVFCGANVVGIHQGEGRALNMLWVCSEAEHNFPAELAPLLDKVINRELAQDQAHKSRLYRISGHQLLSYYQVRNEHLMHSSKLPEHAQFCIISSGLFIAGGLRDGHAVDETYIFDTGLGILGLRQKMITPRSAHCLGSLRNEVYCIGGRNTISPTHCELCSLRTNVPKQGPDLPSGRVGAGAVVFKERLYVIGGSLDGSQAIIKEIVRLTESGWEEVPHSLPQFTTHVLSAASEEGLWILSNELCRWDPETTNSKHEVSQCTEPRSLHVSNSSLFIFTDQRVQEVQVRPEPWVWRASSLLERIK